MSLRLSVFTFETIRFIMAPIFPHPDPEQRFVVKVNMSQLGQSFLKYKVTQDQKCTHITQKCIHVPSIPECIEGSLGFKTYYLLANMYSPE